MAAASPITVIGSANADYVMRVAQLPKAGETLIGHAFDVHHGGKGANQAVACARLGAHTRFIACIGDDAAGHSALRALNSDGIDTTHVQQTTAQHTGSALIFVDDAGENCIGVAAGANQALDTNAIDQLSAVIGDSAWLLTQLETPVASVLRAAHIAHAANVPVALNPAPANDALPAELWPLLQLVTPNRGELASLTGRNVDSEADVVSAAQALRQRGCDIVVTTLGSAGAMIVDCDGATHVASETVQAIDTVGAGDTFNGALVVALSEQQTLTDAVRFANKAAAIAVTRHGAQAAVPYRHELDSAA